MSESREIIDIVADAVRKASESVSVQFTDCYGEAMPPCKPAIGYVFGSAEYFKDYLDEAAKVGRAVTFPLVLLFCPFQEARGGKHMASAKVNLLIACSTHREWSNAERKAYSFERILRPIYRSLLDALASDLRLDFGYAPKARHEYSENYSYGKYGAYVDRSGEMVSEPIDAIDIRNLEIKVNNPKCR